MANHQSSSWAPQSPDLTGYAGPQSPDLSQYRSRLVPPPHTTTSWAPQSPDISGLVSHDPGYDQQPSHFSLDSGPGHGVAFGGSYPHHPSHHHHQHHHHHPPPSTSNPGFYQDAMPTTRSQRFKKEQEEEDAEWIPRADVKPVPVALHDAAAPQPRMDTNGIEVRTKFPVARIKRLMQADEDIGKVAQVTPVVMAKALELFMIRLITASSTVAKSRNSKRVMVQHMKAAVMQDEQFDNLREIVGKVPDAPTKKSGTDSDDEDAEGPKKRKKSTAGGKGKKRRGSDDDF